MNNKSVKILINGKKIKTLEKAAEKVGITLEQLYRKLIICDDNFYTGFINNYTLQVWTDDKTFNHIKEHDLNYEIFKYNLYKEYLNNLKNQ